MHPDTVAARQDLADAYRRAGRAEEAIRLYPDSLAHAESTVGPAHRDTVAARQDLAIVLYEAGRSDDAAKALERALADWQRVPGAGPDDTIAARASLAAIYCANGRAQGSDPALRERGSRPRATARIGAPGHAPGPLESRRRVPQGQAPARGDRRWRGHARRLRALPGSWPPGDPDHAGEPRARLSHGRPAQAGQRSLRPRAP